MTIKKEDSKFFEINESGDVFSIFDKKKYKIGNIKNIDTDTALSIFKNKFKSVEQKLNMFIDRLNTLSPKKIQDNIDYFENELKNPKMIGDILSLQKKFNNIKKKASSQIDVAKDRIKNEKENALQELEKITENMEKISNNINSETVWKISGKNVGNMLNAWKEINRNTKNINKTQEHELFVRFSVALKKFRKLKSIEMKKIQKQTLKQKTELLEKVKRIVVKNDNYAIIANQLKNIQIEWKKIGITPKNLDGKIYSEFKKSINEFFEKKRKTENKMPKLNDSDNFKKKMEILTNTEKIFENKDLNEIRLKWNKIQIQLNDIGYISAKNHKIIKSRIEKFNKIIQEKTNQEWEKSNVDKQNRILSSTADLEKSIQKLNEQLEIAKKSKNKKEISKFESAIKVKNQWLEQIKKIKL